MAALGQPSVPLKTPASCQARRIRMGPQPGRGTIALKMLDVRCLEGPHDCRTTISFFLDLEDLAMFLSYWGFCEQTWSKHFAHWRCCAGWVSMQNHSYCTPTALRSLEAVINTRPLFLHLFAHEDQNITPTTIVGDSDCFSFLKALKSKKNIASTTLFEPHKPKTSIYCAFFPPG